MKIKSVLGVCAGQGALLLPFKNLLVGNIEPRGVFYTPKNETWNLNFPDTPLVRKISDINKKRVSIILGSPSCGHSSVLSYSRKKTLGKPKEDQSINLFIEAVQKFRPKTFLMENLPTLLKFITLEDWKELLPNYEIIAHTHPVIAFGNSQRSRKRLVLIGVKKGLNINSRAFSKVFKVTEPMKVSDIMRKVRPELNFREADNRKVSMYHQDDPKKKTLTVSEVRRLWTTEFKAHYKWPMNTQKMRTLPGVYRNKINDYPLTVRPSSRQFMPNGEMLGLDDYRLIQGFPKTFQVYFDPKKPVYWLNKGRVALTKGSVVEVGTWFKKCLTSALGVSF